MPKAAKITMPNPPFFRANGLADLTLRSAIQRHITLVLEYTGGQRFWAAQELGVNVSTIHRWATGESRPMGEGTPMDDKRKVFLNEKS